MPTPCKRYRSVKLPAYARGLREYEEESIEHSDKEKYQEVIASEGQSVGITSRSGGSRSNKKIRNGEKVLTCASYGARKKRSSR
jgi:hypothetical protein